MKTCLIAALVALPLLASANPSPPPPSVPQPTDDLKSMTERLNLTPAQQKQIGPILAAEAKETKAVEDNKTLNVQAKIVQVSMIHRMTLQQIQTVCTPQQMAQLGQWQVGPGATPPHP